MQKVKIESVMWGAGTALSELPPYFMARAARLSGYDPDDEEDLKEFEELPDPESMVGATNRESLSIMRKLITVYLRRFFFPVCCRRSWTTERSY